MRTSPEGSRAIDLPVTILYATNNGGALRCAACLGRIMQGRRFLPKVCNAFYYDVESLVYERALLLVTAGREDGQPPLDGEALFERVVRRGGLDLRRLRYSVAALGAPEVPTEPHAGRAFDSALSVQGAVRVYPRLDCDADFEIPFLVWTSGVLAALRNAFNGEQRHSPSLLLPLPSQAPRPCPIRVEGSLCVNHCAAKVDDDRNKKRKRERRVMKIQCSSKVGWRAVWLLASCLTVLSQMAHAQVRTIPGGVGGGAGAGVQFVQQLDGSGPERGFNVVIGGPGSAIDVGASLLKHCDTNQDGVATPVEVKVGLLTWFQQADTDTNGALSEVELATALKQIFPVPQPPPGFPPPPEDSGLHNLLATELMASVDANQDGWMTLKEAVAFVGQSFPQWDLDSSGALDASEFANAFAQFMPPPPQSQGIGVSGSAGGKFFRTFRAP